MAILKQHEVESWQHIQGVRNAFFGWPSQFIHGWVKKKNKKQKHENKHNAIWCVTRFPHIFCPFSNVILCKVLAQDLICLNIMLCQLRHHANQMSVSLLVSCQQYNILLCQSSSIGAIPNYTFKTFCVIGVMLATQDLAICQSSNRGATPS